MNAEQAVAVRDVMTGTIEQEAGGTRKVINNITNREFKPDAKSRTAWQLATHIAMSEVWFAKSIADTAFVWAGEPPVPAEMTDPAAVTRWHEKHLGDALRRLRAMTPDQLLKPVEAFGMKAPAVNWLTMMNNHTIHHRGQLAAYLRPMGSKVPAIYGDSADEPMQPA